MMKHENFPPPPPSPPPPLPQPPSNPPPHAPRRYDYGKNSSQDVKGFESEAKPKKSLFGRR
jgi:hypothetical protein